MHPAARAAARRFPLLGRPRPTCPALPLRVQEVTDAADAARQKAEHAMPDAAHALNKAALIASDCAMPDLARDLCWQHIDTYRRRQRPLTVLQVRYLLEPVLNLARLDIRTEAGNAALTLLAAMHDAVTGRRDLTVDGHTLPTASPVGPPHEHRELRQWVWLQLIGEGVRALALAGRWTDAAEHAHAHNGVGLHLMEGRQAAIIAAVHRDADHGRALLAHSALTQPWEVDVAACLHLMAHDPAHPRTEQHLRTTVNRFTDQTPMTGYACYRARLGLTIATMAAAARPDLVATLLTRITAETIASGDGYAARDILGFRDPTNDLTTDQRQQLTSLKTRAGLGLGSLPEAIERQLRTAAHTAANALDTALDAST